MTLAQGAFLCLIFVFPIIAAVVVEWRSIDRVMAHLDDLPDAKYMDFHETGGPGKEPLVEYGAKIGALNLLAGPRPRSARRFPRGRWVLRRRRNFWAKKFAHGPFAIVPTEIRPNPKRFRDRGEHYLWGLLNLPCA